MRSESISPKSCRACASTRMPSCSIAPAPGAQRQLDVLEQRLPCPCSRRRLPSSSVRPVDAGRPDGKDAFLRERGLVRRRDVQIVLRELRQGVCPARRIEQIGRHSRVEHDPRRLHAESQQRTQQPACCRARSSARPRQTGCSTAARSPFRAFRGAAHRPSGPGRPCAARPRAGRDRPPRQC